MELGIFAKTFDRPTLEETLDAVRDSGLRTIQFNMALAGGSSLPDEIPARLAAQISAQANGRELRIAAVSGTYNMAHPDPDARAAGRPRLAGLIAAAPSLGTRVVTLCSGSRDPDDMWRHHEDNHTREAWRDMLDGIQAALTIAETHDVTLAIEPEHNNIVDCAPTARRLLDEIRSPHLKVIIDAANLIEAGDLDAQGDTLRLAFDLLGDDVVLAHAKDVRHDGAIVAAGQGQLDYPLYLTLLARAGKNIPLILHGLDETHVSNTVAFLWAALARTLGVVRADGGPSLQPITSGATRSVSARRPIHAHCRDHPSRPTAPAGLRSRRAGARRPRGLRRADREPRMAGRRFLRDPCPTASRGWRSPPRSPPASSPRGRWCASRHARARAAGPSGSRSPSW